MQTNERTKAQKDLVETIGRIYEKQGLGVNTGRISGLLTVMDKEQFTFDEIVEELKISKSSASNGLKVLQAQNAIEYITMPGDRRRYFRLRTQDKFAIINNHKEILERNCELFGSIIELKADKNSRNSLYLKDACNLMMVFLEKFEELKSKYLNETKI